MKIQMLKISIFLISVLAVLACETKKTETKSNDESTSLLDKFLPILLDSLLKNYEKKIIVHYDIYPDNIKHFTIKGVIEANEKDGNEKLMLLKKLYNVIDDSVYLNMREGEYGNYYFYNNPETIKQMVDFSSPNYFGSVNLTKVVFNEQKDLACFYLALQCGSKCGSGYIAVLKKVNDAWIITDFIKIWG